MTLDTFLLNPKETVTISSFLANFPEEQRVSVDVDWHIEGVRQPKELKRESSRFRNRISTLANLVLLVILVPFAVYLVQRNPFEDMEGPWVLLLFPLFLFTGAMVIAMVGAIVDWVRDLG